MNNELIELGRRAVACVPLDRWPSGALLIPPSSDPLERWRMVESLGDVWIGTNGDKSAGLRGDGSDGFEFEGWVPDLSDAATLGCLLELVRELWSDPGIGIACSSYSHEAGYRYHVVGGHHHGLSFRHGVEAMHYANEEEALVSAMEAAVRLLKRKRGAALEPAE